LKAHYVETRNGHTVSSCKGLQKKFAANLNFSGDILIWDVISLRLLPNLQTQKAAFQTLNQLLSWKLYLSRKL
jgi:hypothetical protein